MAIDAVTIGPFKGGLNNVSQAGESTDTEVVDLVNMGLTMDGALTSRPPMKIITGYGTAHDSIEILGVYRESIQMWHLIVQHRQTNGWVITAWPLGDYSAHTVIRSTINIFNKASAFVQVNDWGYFSAQPSPSAGLIGFKWKPNSTYTELPQMPRGTCMVSFKNRLWITGQVDAVNSSRIWFSKIDAGGIKVDEWNTAVDYFDVAPGEGGYSTALVALNSSLIIFKNDGAWRFSFSSTPAKGVVDKISGTVGAANKNVVVEFNNLVYSYDQGKLYELVNNTFSAINKKIEFREDNEAVHLATGTDLSVVGTNIVFRYFNAIYVFSGETGTWSQWRSKIGIPGKFIELPSDSNSSKSSVYYAPTKGATDREGTPVDYYRLMTLSQDYSSVTPVEDIECVVRTKAYDYKAPAVYKRLFWWGIDHKSSLTFTASAIPVIKKRIPTWGELKPRYALNPLQPLEGFMPLADAPTEGRISGYTWGELKRGTWGNLLSWKGLITSVSDSFDVTNEQTDNGRIFSKIKKSLRFRQISYEIRMHTKGNASTGPVKIFSLITYVAAKHNVVDKNN